MPVRFGEEISSGAACNPAGMTARRGGTIGGEELAFLVCPNEEQKVSARPAIK